MSFALKNIFSLSRRVRLDCKASCDDDVVVMWGSNSAFETTLTAYISLTSLCLFLNVKKSLKYENLSISFHS